MVFERSPCTRCSHPKAKELELGLGIMTADKANLWKLPYCTDKTGEKWWRRWWEFLIAAACYLPLGSLCLMLVAFLRGWIRRGAGASLRSQIPRQSMSECSAACVLCRLNGWPSLQLSAQFTDCCICPCAQKSIFHSNCETGCYRRLPQHTYLLSSIVTVGVPLVLSTQHKQEVFYLHNAVVGTVVRHNWNWGGRGGEKDAWNSPS